MLSMNQKQIEKMMKQMGIQNQKVEADEVIIKSGSKQIIITNPEVMKIKMGGQETFQITGEVSEKSEDKPAEQFSEEDIEVVMAQSGASEDAAREALNEEGDIASAIIKLKG